MISGGDDFSEERAGAYSPTTVMTEDLLSELVAARVLESRSNTS